MKKRRFIEEQIIAVLRENEAGAKAGDLGRKRGVSEATIYNWKARCGAMDMSDSRRLKELESENARLEPTAPKCVNHVVALNRAG